MTPERRERVWALFDEAAEWLPAESARDAKGFVLTGTDVNRFRPVAAVGSRAVPAGNERPGDPGGRRYPRGVRQARGLRGG